MLDLLSAALSAGQHPDTEENSNLERRWESVLRTSDPSLPGAAGPAFGITGTWELISLRDLLTEPSTPFADTSSPLHGPRASVAVPAEPYGASALWSAKSWRPLERTCVEFEDRIQAIP